MQVFYGMGRGKYMQPYFSQVVALAPCFVPNSLNYIPDFNKTTYAAIAGLLEVLDIESLFGPHWDEQVERLCDVLGRSSEMCVFIREIPVGVIAGGEIDGYSEIGVQ